MGIFIYLLIAKLQDAYADRSSAWQWAVAYALLSSLLSWQGILPFVMNFVILALYSWGYFNLLRKFTDNLLLWILIYVGGVVFPITLSLLLIK
ncbi:hypothetical protein [Alysiella filiformis]|uniref:Uncharacterized protein n=1 Tax=Alysiella filiformis DSM 16848 TaxID=1120981 RepID=A0A286E810_9NEIS|nr:hypothetical protein [Alysiella filiformis]QMT32033.1 hypothetical protein H3L97_03950 [Alysiella filiformis]UBQ57058.1 hypothetical protein JF568_04725 [Alysiella filiformis DSM 16848]SOD67036.1 hypothetical protein SAMN02746062_00781 [Alysiella filiformis DSM 16848]